jgi:Undecaprenyl-phosphate glucose phosphotransferase
MIKQRSHILCVWFQCWDVALTAAAWLGAYLIRFGLGWFPINSNIPPFSLCLQQLPLVVILSAAAYRVTGQYEIHRLRRFYEEMISVGKGVVLVSLLMMATTFFLQSTYDSRGTMLIFSMLAAVLLVGMRRASWSAIRWLRRHGYNQAYALIVGTGRVARATAHHLSRATWLGIKPVGFVEDRSQEWSSDLDILGGTSDLPALIAKHRIAYVFICLPLGRFQEAKHAFDILSQSVIEVQLVTDVPGLAGLSLGVSPLDEMTMISLRETPHFGLNRFVKRAMDIVLSLTLLLLLAPVLAAIAILVKLTSRGPVFYTQERCSLNGQPFKMLKFRSMRVDAESQSGAVWAAKDDPRRTAFGSFLRKTSLDELPQLINVLCGDMSLVGPRPERPVFIEKFRKSIPNYMARHSVKCGITGWAQVNGWRGNTSLRRRVQYDLFYINHWTPWLDLRILWLTISRALFDRHAY